MTESETQAAIQSLMAALGQTREALEKLAALSGLEYSQDLRDWVSKQKLEAFKRDPR